MHPDVVIHHIGIISKFIPFVNVYGNSYSYWINPCKIESKENS
jgi:hypothetical protein